MTCIPAFSLFRSNSLLLPQHSGGTGLHGKTRGAPRAAGLESLSGNRAQVSTVPVGLSPSSNDSRETKGNVTLCSPASLGQKSQTVGSWTGSS